ncbi:MAG TPA: zinc ribbon domain-containing protein [Candidatus Dormibacteraeota bacterium]|nr:zinc ribbon domain-containing protein [Candidatus Dormibacteraeota bacterium]
MNCPQCGLELPERARFCARCGTDMGNPAGPRRNPSGPSARRPPRSWVPILLWLGTAVPLLMAVACISIWPDARHDAAQMGGTPEQWRVTAALLVGYFALVLLLQVLACIGLTLERAWAAGVATALCILWMLTLVAIPFSIAFLLGIWSGGRQRAPAPG